VLKQHYIKFIIMIKKLRGWLRVQPNDYNGTCSLSKTLKEEVPYECWTQNKGIGYISFYLCYLGSLTCVPENFFLDSIIITSIHEEYYLEHRCLCSFLSNTDYFTLVHHFLHTFILLLCIQQQQKTNPLFYTSRKSLFYFFLFKVVTLEE